VKYKYTDRYGNEVVGVKKKKSSAYKLRVAIKWAICFGALLLVLIFVGILENKFDGMNLLTELAEKTKNEEIQVEETEQEPIEEPVEEPVVEEEPEDTSYFTVCLDPGHGGIDKGNEDNGREEKIDNMNLCLKVKERLEAYGVEVVLTHTEDVKTFLEERTTVANSSGATYFVSLHRNHGQANGVESWINGTSSEETKTLGQYVHNAIVNAGVSRDRGLKTGSSENSEGGYYVLRNTTMPAVLVELGFMDSDEDNMLFDQNMDAYAQGIADALVLCYEEYHGENKGSDGENTEGAVLPENQVEAAAYTGLKLNYDQVADVSSLSSELLNWGQGNNVDANGIPTGCAQYNDKFGKYNADFYINTNGEKTIYLTLDEGYEYGCTPTILKTLSEKGVQAVFFVTKSFAEENPDLVRQIIDNGHILGNHSVTHPSNGLPSKTLAEQEEEVMGNHRYVKEKFGYDMYLFRFPAGKFSEQSLAILNNCGYRSVFWSFAYLDYDVNNQPNEAESLSKMVSKLHPGAIYLLHAESWTNTNVLGDFIDQARAAGYTFGSYADIANRSIQ